MRPSEDQPESTTGEKQSVLHRPLIEGIIIALDEIFAKNLFADRVLENLFHNNKRWGSRDRGLVAECTYDLVRWWRLYWFLLDQDPESSVESLGRLIGAWAIRNNVKLPDVPLFKTLDPKRLQSRYEFAQKTRMVAQSIPDWLDEIGVKELGEKAWEEDLAAMNKQAPMVIRVNTLTTTKEALSVKLENEDWPNHPNPLCEDAIVLDRRGNLFTNPAFEFGWFEMQDAGSQAIAPFLDPKPGMQVVDACAGAGGKTLHIAALMKNKGRIIAMDTDRRKLEELKKRARRNEVSNVETRQIEDSKTIKRLAGKADRVLLDAPCSGTGVFRRNPDAKWKLDYAFIERIKKTQAEILDSYCRMVKPGGILVYATCSVFPSENQEQVKAFLAKHPEFTFVEERVLRPSENDCDGFYMGKMRRGEEGKNGKEKEKEKEDAETEKGKAPNQNPAE